MAAALVFKVTENKERSGRDRLDIYMQRDPMAKCPTLTLSILYIIWQFTGKV